MEKLGRSREHMKILPACFVVVGDTVEEAQAKRAKLDSFVDYANAIASPRVGKVYRSSAINYAAPTSEAATAPR